jgi:hypothetical protein
MGRFDALTQLEEKQNKIAPLPVVPTPVSKVSQPQTIKNQNDTEKKLAGQQTRKPVTLSPTYNSLEKPEKYTTRLERSLIKKIQLYAVEKEMKDYQVVKTALEQYFERNK